MNCLLGIEPDPLMKPYVAFAWIPWGPVLRHQNWTQSDDMYHLHAIHPGLLNGLGLSARSCHSQPIVALTVHRVASAYVSTGTDRIDFALYRILCVRGDLSALCVFSQPSGCMMESLLRLSSVRAYRVDRDTNAHCEAKTNGILAVDVADDDGNLQPFALPATQLASPG